MGVFGLTTYLREHQRILALEHSHLGNSGKEITFVIDAWSFIYHITETVSLPWVYGGEYQQYYDIAIKFVEAWLSVGVKLYFVFDGALPASKVKTKVSRYTSNFVAPSLLFYRTSAVARSQPRFLAEARIIPPLIYVAFSEALISLAPKGVHTILADNEGDRFCVELAGQVGAYVLSQDSDFVILNCEGYRGYIPLDSLVWITPPSPEPSAVSEETMSVSFEELGFQQVKRSKSRKASAPRSTEVIPADNVTGLSFVVFTPDALASHLEIQVSLLPLLASLIGNDFTMSSGTDKHFFERRLSARQRIPRVARALKSILEPEKKRGSKSLTVPTTGMDLIRLSVEKLLVRPDLLTSKERDQLIDAIVESILQYAFTPDFERVPNNICPVHDASTCSLVFLQNTAIETESHGVERRQKTPESFLVRDAYVRAYRTGQVSSELLNVLNTATFWPHIFLEDPDKEACQATIGRPLRLWVYAILEESFGIPRLLPEHLPPESRVTSAGSVSERTEIEEDEDEDELVDVIEETSEEGDDAALDVARDWSASNVPDSIAAIVASQEPGPPSVIEYTRRGIRVAENSIIVPSFEELSAESSTFNSDDIPLLATEDGRQEMLLRVMKSNTEAILSHVQSNHIYLLLSLRWVIRTMGLRPKAEERWTKREAKCLLLTCLPSKHKSETRPPESNDAPPELINRHIQLTAQFLCAMENAMYLCQALLLTKRVPISCRMFSGQRFHHLLSLKTAPDLSDPLFIQCWKAVEEGMDEYWGVERGNHGKKERRRERKKDQGSGARVETSSQKGLNIYGGLFAALAEM